jgi:hypothetical protein
MRGGRWGMYYASIVTMQYHPGAGTKLHRILSLKECAAIADEMENITCHGYSEAPPYSAESWDTKAKEAPIAQWPPTLRPRGTGKNE